MSEEENKDFKPFDSFSRVNMWLTAAGYSHLYNPRNKYTKACHKLYRKFVLICVYIYSLQHIVHTVQMFLLGDSEKIVEGAIMCIPMTHLSIKVTSLYFGTKRIDKLVELMEDPIFGANSDGDKILMKENTITMRRLSNYATTCVTVVVFLWGGGPVVMRMQDPNTIIATYMPFKQDTWPKFLLALFLDTFGVILWAALANYNSACIIATFYAQSRLQLKIINYNLEHLFDKSRSQVRGSNNFEFIDVLDDSIQERFVYYIKRYERVCWFTDEVTSIFNVCVAIQFLGTSISSCLAIFQMSSTDTLSATFAFSFGFYLATQSEIYMYCYYGGLIEAESQQMADCLYLGEWTTSSPKFRRQLLIAMARWTRPVTPKVAGIVPLSLVTFVSITRTAYTLFTVLKSTNNEVDGGK